MAIQAQQQCSENLGLAFCSSSQDWMMENGNGGNGFNEQQQQQLYLSLQQQQQQQMMMMMLQNQQKRMMNQDLGRFDYSSNQQQQQQQVVSCTTNNQNHHQQQQQQLQSMAFSQALLAQVEKQKQEIDRFIVLQNERLRLALHEQRKQQLAVVLASLESKALALLKQKDQELIEVSKKTMELEDCLRKAEMENQAWQRVARETEAMVIALNNTLEQVRENAYNNTTNCFACGAAAAEDAGSCCDDNDEHEDEEEVANKAATTTTVIMENKKRRLVCKGCESRESCVLFLPCRHLCSCKCCEPYLGCCPVCKSVKEASMEVYLS